MKNIKNYKEFLNEELTHLPPPSDDETFEADPFIRIEYINKGKLDKKFYPNNQEIINAFQDKPSTYELIFCSKNGILDGVIDAIKRGADPDYRTTENQSALSYACSFGFIDIVKYLIDQNVDINFRDKFNTSPLLYAIEYNHFEIVKYLVEHGAHVSYQALCYKRYSDRPRFIFDFKIINNNIKEYIMGILYKKRKK